MKTQIKLLKKGIKVNGEYFPVSYSSSKNNIHGNATIYINTYKRLPQETKEVFEVANDTDSMTDYYEQDRIRVSSENEFFSKVNELAGV